MVILNPIRLTNKIKHYSTFYGKYLLVMDILYLSICSYMGIHMGFLTFLLLCSSEHICVRFYKLKLLFFLRKHTEELFCYMVSFSVNPTQAKVI